MTSSICCGCTEAWNGQRGQWREIQSWRTTLRAAPAATVRRRGLAWRRHGQCSRSRRTTLCAAPAALRRKGFAGRWHRWYFTSVLGGRAAATLRGRGFAGGRHWWYFRSVFGGRAVTQPARVCSLICMLLGHCASPNALSRHTSGGAHVDVMTTEWYFVGVRLRCFKTLLIKTSKITYLWKLCVTC